MINPAAVEAFRNRPLNDGHRVKKLSARAVDRRLDRILGKFGDGFFLTPPYLHQKACFLLGARRPGYMLFMDMGTGKTKVALDLIRYRRLEWEGDPAVIEAEGLGAPDTRFGALVLVPNVSNVGEWLEQARTHASDLTVIGLTDTMGRSVRENAVAQAWDVLVCTYQGYVSLVCKRKGGGMALDPARAEALESRVTMVVYDESAYLKNWQSLTFRLAKRLLRRSSFRLGLTGTPFNRSPIDLWSQFYAVDGGETLGGTLGIYRAAFFREKPRFWGRGFDYVFRERRKDELGRMIRHRSIRYAEDECLDLPGNVRTRHPVDMTEVVRGYYDEVAAKVRAAPDDIEVMKNAYHYFRQLASGYVKVRPKDGSEPQVLAFDPNPKMDALESILKEIPASRKIIIFCWYQTTGAMIAERLTALEAPFVRLYGKSKGKAEIVARFKHDPAVRILLASKSGALGLNLQVANHVIFYEGFDSAIDRQQAERRVRRPGQTRRTYFHDILVRKSVDEKILQAVEAGRSLLAQLMDGTATVV